MQGKPTYEIDRTYTHKKDFIKVYTEDILKIANMRRTTKWYWGKVLIMMMIYIIKQIIIIF